MPAVLGPAADVNLDFCAENVAVSEAQQSVDYG
jgi:hypothetical protein